MKKISIITAIAIALLLVATGCSSGTGTSASPSSSASAAATASVSASATPSASSGKTVKVRGIGEAVTLVGGLKSSYMTNNPDVTIDATANDSNTGIAMCADGTADIALSTRNLEDIEKSTFTGMTEKVLCLDGICIVAGKGSAITNLTADQIKSIFTGLTTNWKNVGGTDEAIKVYTLDSSSEIRAAFNSVFLGKDGSGKQIDTSDSNTTPETSVDNMVNVLESDSTGIGYLPMSVLISAQTKESQPAAQPSASPSASASAQPSPTPSPSPSVSQAIVTLKALSVDGVAPTKENIASGSYKYYMSIILMTRNPKSDASAFVDYCFGNDAAAYIQAQGFVKP